MVAITGQVPGPAIGTDAFQEADIRGITMPITKHSFLITKTADIAGAIASAFHIAGTGRPGPVLVDIAKDALQARAPFVWPRQLDLPGYRPVTKPHGKQVKEAVKLICRSRRPVLYVGGGVVKAGAWKELRTLAELTRIPLVTTLMARGVFPDSHDAEHGHAGHARHGGRRRCAAAQRPVDLSRRTLRRPGDGPAGHRSPQGPRSSTPTSTRPRSPRTGPPTSRSSATPRR